MSWLVNFISEAIRAITARGMNNLRRIWFFLVRANTAFLKFALGEVFLKIKRGHTKSKADFIHSASYEPKPAFRLKASRMAGTATNKKTLSVHCWFTQERNLLPRIIILFVLMASLLSACSPQADNPSATLTKVSADILATWTASAPIVIAPQATEDSSTPAPAQQPWQVPTAQPAARIKSESLNLREGPGTDYPSLEMMANNTRLLILGQADFCKWYKVLTPTGRKGWVSGGDYYVEVTQACDVIPEASFQPPNGTLLKDFRSIKGEGKLTVANATTHDAVVVLTNLSRYTEFAFYVQAGQQVVMEGVLDNTYELFFELGNNWLSTGQVFEESLGKYHSSNAFTFDATRKEVSITLATSPDAAALVEDEQFPSLQE